MLPGLRCRGGQRKLDILAISHLMRRPDAAGFRAMARRSKTRQDSTGLLCLGFGNNLFERRDDTVDISSFSVDDR